MWLNGPAWLYSNTHHAYDDTTVPDDCLPEMKMMRESVSMTTHSFMASECEQEGLIVRCEEFSTFSRLLRVTSLVMQFIETLLKNEESSFCTRRRQMLHYEGREVFD